MKQTLAAPLALPAWGEEFPVLQLLHPGQRLNAFLLALAVGLLLAWAAVTVRGWPLWAATAIVLLTLLPVCIGKWREERRRYGWQVMLLSVVLTTQGAHTIEHLMQWVQYHVFYWTARQSSGLLSPANAEWVHFVWNWAVLLVVLALFWGGMRNGWMILLTLVALAHTVEHTYLFVRYLQVLAELRELEVANVTAQGLAGIIGRDGWLSRCSVAQTALLRSLPGLTTASRLDVHFWWNTIEMTFLLLAGGVYLRRLGFRVGTDKMTR